MRTDDLLQKALNLEWLSAEEGVFLFENAGTAELMHVGNRLRQHHVPGNIVTWIIDRNSNTTNVCVANCKFCNFYRRPGHGESYITSIEEYKQKIEETFRFGGEQLLLQGGHHPDLGLDFYTNLFRQLKELYPALKLHALGPPEIAHVTKLEKSTHIEVLQALKDAGLDSLPGAGAEILSDRVRRLISKGKCGGQEWLDIMHAAHQVGLTTSATMMFGHIETQADWVDHMLTLRSMQHSTGGFTEFVPLGFVYQEAPLSFMKEMKERRLGPSGHDVLHVHALARILLGASFRNIQASWVKEGEKMAALLLSAGCNDLGGTLINESISTAAGASHGQLFSPRKLRRLIRAAGREPVQRNTVYDVLKDFPDGDDPVDALDQVENPNEVFGSYQGLTQASENRFVHPSKKALV